MDLKKEVRRRIEELTRLAYERGYRDGAQSALAEIEKVAGEDLAEQVKASGASLPAGKDRRSGHAPTRDSKEAEGAAADSETERCRAEGGDGTALHPEAPDGQR